MSTTPAAPACHLRITGDKVPLLLHRDPRFDALTQAEVLANGHLRLAFGAESLLVGPLLPEMVTSAAEAVRSADGACRIQVFNLGPEGEAEPTSHHEAPFTVAAEILQALAQ